VYFEVELGPQQRWHTCANVILVEGERIRRPARNNERRHSDDDRERLQRRWLDRATALTSANEDVYRAYGQSVEDLARCGCTTTTRGRTSGCRPPASPGSSPCSGATR
jgi:hypothetical protein